MGFRNWILLLLGLAVSVTYGKMPLKLRCPLVWVGSATEMDIPKNPVLSQVGYFAVAKGLINSGADVIGSLRLNNGTSSMAYLAGSSESEQVLSFDVLTNPHECSIAWVKQNDADVQNFGIKVEGYYAGRVEDSGDLFCGIVNHGNRLITYVDTVSSGLKTSENYYVLISYSRGLSLILNNFIFDTDPMEGDLDFLGVDEIHNRGEVDVSQTVIHSKSVTESFSFTESHSQSWTVSVDMKVEASMKSNNLGMGASLGAGVSTTIEDGWSSTIGKSTTREISVSRTLSVPALTSVQACTVINMKEDFSIGYEARAEFRSKGLNGSEIVDILEKHALGDAWQVGVVLTAEGDAAVRYVEGIISGSLAMSTKFIVVPIDSVEGCFSIQNSVEEARQAKRKIRNVK